MATVDISTGVEMKQRESNKDEGEWGGAHYKWGAVMSLKATEGVQLLHGRKNTEWFNMVSLFRYVKNGIIHIYIYDINI